MAKIRVIVQANGELSVFADEGTFGEAKEQIEAIMTKLKAQGFKLIDESPVEAHRHDGEAVKAHTHTHH